MSWRSLEFRLAAWYCVLLMTGLGAIGVVLWFGVNYAMVAAVDDLLAARVDRLADFIDSEFPAEFSDAEEAGELVGLIEDVDPEKRWFVLGGTRIQIAPTTVFEIGASQEIDFRVGQYVEVEIDPVDGEAVAAEVSFEADFFEELREELYEYTFAVPDGRLMRIRTADDHGGFSEEDLDSSPDLPWLGPPEGARNFHNFENADGTFRVLVAEVSLAGLRSEVQVATSLAPVIAAREQLVSWLLWAIPIAALLSFSGGYAIGRAALRPVEDVADVASRMDISRLSERLKVPPTEGIPEDKIHRVFDRFYRADPSRTRSKGGFGLGLSIAKWIAESHGGVIEARSENGKGSTFSVRFPRAHV